MVKRFYCDFCDKSFPYNRINRKKHNEGIQHLTLRQDYYNNFKSFRLQLEEEVIKKPCYKHLTSSNCSFQSKCRCSHKSLNDLNSLIKNYESEVTKKRAKCSEKLGVKKRKNEIDQNNEKKIIDFLKEKNKELFDQLVPKYKLPEQLRKFKYIPLSLVPPTSDDFLNSDLNSWG